MGVVLICCTDSTAPCDAKSEHQKNMLVINHYGNIFVAIPVGPLGLLAGREWGRRRGRDQLLLVGWMGGVGAVGVWEGGGGWQMPKRPYLEHLSLGLWQGFQLLLPLLLAPAKGPLHASALALVSCHLGFLQKVIWQQLLQPPHD